MLTDEECDAIAVGAQNEYGAGFPVTGPLYRTMVRAAYARGLENAARVCEAYLHNVPDEGGDELDHIGRYSNSTVRRCAAAIRERAK